MLTRGAALQFLGMHDCTNQKVPNLYFHSPHDGRHHGGWVQQAYCKPHRCKKSFWWIGWCAKSSLWEGLGPTQKKLRLKGLEMASKPITFLKPNVMQTGLLGFLSLLKVDEKFSICTMPWALPGSILCCRACWLACAYPRRCCGGIGTASSCMDST